MIREEWLQDLIGLLRADFNRIGSALPEKIRVLRLPFQVSPGEEDSPCWRVLGRRE